MEDVHNEAIRAHPSPTKGLRAASHQGLWPRSLSNTGLRPPGAGVTCTEGWPFREEGKQWPISSAPPCVPGKAAGSTQNPTSAPKSRWACADFTAQGGRGQITCLSSSRKEEEEEEEVGMGCDSRPGPTGEIFGPLLRTAEGSSCGIHPPPSSLSHCNGTSPRRLLL